MGFALDRGQGFSIEQAVQAALLGQIDDAAAVLQSAQEKSAEPSRSISLDEAVHEARKSLKRARAVLRLLRPGLGDKAVRSEARALAATARRLAAARDARILHDTLERLEDAARSPSSGAAEAAEAAVKAARQARSGQGVPHVPDEALAQVRSELAEAHERVRSLPHWGGVRGVLRRGLVHMLRQIRTAYTAASDAPTAENFHGLRKRIKDFFYVGRLLVDVSPNLLTPLLKDLDRLGEALGEEHDLALLGERIHARPDEWGGADHAASLQALIDRERRRLQDEARPVCERLVVLSPRRFAAAVVRELDATWQRPPEVGS